MTSINHALTGALIGLTVSQPAIALPVAFVSHFVCDALPHYDSDPKGARVHTAGFRIYLLTEATLCFLLVLLLAVTRPHHWAVAAICAFLATSPDLFWINRFRAAQQNKPWKPNAFLRFAGDIQWFAKPIGGVVEIVWFTAACVLLAAILR